MTDSEKRIKLAEAMGWHDFYEDKYHPCGYEDGQPVAWHTITGSPTGQILPDPLTDANDCEALIKHLVKQGWEYIRQNGADDPPTYVALRKDRRNLDWWGDDYKQGVYKLALQVLK